MMKSVEGVSDKFNLETYLKAKKVAQKVVLLAASQFDVGMTEEDGVRIIEELCVNFGIEKLWHPHRFRIGKNTTKSFREKSEPNIKLLDNDIYFIDIGPVVDGHEADYGQTFTVGQNLEFAHCQKSVKEIFNELKTLWKEQEITGSDLYERGEALAHEKGYILNTKMAGHRLGDFPHALFYKGSLSNFEKKPIDKLWILEILIRHPKKNFGAFFEDILL